MSTKQLTLLSLFAGLMVLSASSFADDIDIYSNPYTGSANIPNVLIVLDNAASFDAAAAACTYDDAPTTIPTLSGKAGGIEQCALNNVVNKLQPNSDGTAKVKVGVMIYNASGFNTLFGCNSSGSGGCLMVPLTAMDLNGKNALMAKIKSWSLTGSSSMKSNNEADASAMQESWAYYAGKTGMSGTSYTSVATGGCQKNFVIFLANAFNQATTPGDASQAPGTNLNTTVTTLINPNTSAVALLTTPINQQTPFLTKIQIPSGSYGTSSFSCGSYTMPTHSDTSGLYLDEWARYMSGTDLSTGAIPAYKNIVTYTIGVLSTQCKPDWPALLKSTADNGNGKYFATSDYSTVTEALLEILNEVQSVNSVFSSSSLPVSVNTQGTYLNQIYMGLFRPDGSGNPRWVGNLKQYQFQIDSTTNNLYLADATGAQAISSSSTGFISSNAASFWTCTNTPSLTNNPFVNSSSILYKSGAYANLPTCLNNTDPINGFWPSFKNYVTGSAGTAWDLVDGEIVEKGGAAQGLRGPNMTDDYTTAAGTSSNPRKLYTYCPQDPDNTLGLCVSALTNSANAFTTINTNIAPTAFGSGGTVPLSSITRSGLVATATTSGIHSFPVAGSVTISGASPNDYNGAVTITSVPSNTSFTYNLPAEYPTPTATGSYVANIHVTGATISNLIRNTAGTTNSATATATAANIFAAGNLVDISGASPTDYNGNGISVITANSTQFTYSVTVTPPATAAIGAGTNPSTYTVQLSNTSGIPISNAAAAKGSAVFTITTSTAHGLHTGDFVTISGNNRTSINTTYNITVTSTTAFTVTVSNSNQCNTNGGCSGSGGTVTPGPTSPQTFTVLTRNETAVGSATATATIASSYLFASGDIVSIAGGTTNRTAESAYTANSVTITCATTACTTFTYPISTTPASPTSGGTVALHAGTAQTVTRLTRTAPSGSTAGGTTAAATLASGSSGFLNGTLIDIMAASSGSVPATESAYTGTWTITCSPAVASGTQCTSFTYSPLVLTPSPASGSYMTAYSATASVDKNTLINWIRGMDNRGDEQSLCPGAVSGTSSSALANANYSNCPSTVVTVRPSVHGDVLHSRPITVNYGGTTGVVVYYGSNDGAYHAVNGNQTVSIGSTPPGGELWGFVPADFFGKYNRQRLNLPMLQLPSTPQGISPTPQKKDYFADGPTGLYQSINTSGSTDKAVLYIGMRRGGRFIYAMDVSNPATPTVVWKISNGSSGFNELGQTWSLPKVAYVDGYPNPVVIFGAGYDDGSEDTDGPPPADTMGRGIFIVDYATGALVWRASPTAPSTTCTTTQCKLQVSGMNYSIPSDITLMDRDGNGKVDRLYATDVGGNVWRVDLNLAAGNTPDKWQVTKLAALGCNTGTCASGTTPRKFFFPAEVITSVSGYNYDAVFVGSGDREHPLITNNSYTVADRMYMLQDTQTGNDGSGLTTITEASLYDCTTACTSSTPYTGQQSGYYHTMQGLTPAGANTPGEKIVNAPLATAGYVYFGSNQPTVSSNTTCSTNLGIARGYRFSPFDGVFQSVIFAGGGLPPSPVSGIVDIVTPTGTVQVPFLIGGGNPDCGSGVDCTSALGGQKPPITVSTKRNRTYRYIENK